LWHHPVNNFILIIYNYDSNAILTEVLKMCRADSILEVYKCGHAQPCTTGLCPKLQCLDNKVSCALQEFMTDETIDFQLVPPHIHCHNTTECAICTFKNHFIAGLCSTDAQFAIHLWDCLLPQAKLTLNLLHRAYINPSLSAWAQLHGAFDFNRTLIAPPGIQVIIHKNPCSDTPGHHMALMGGTLDQH